jgi:hypothetical protein
LLKNKNLIMDNNQAQQGEELVTRAIALMSEYDKPNLLAILKRSGSFATELSSQQEILDASFKALKDSERFRQDLLSYIKSSTSEDANFSNAGGAGWKKFKAGIGKTFKTVFSQENVAALSGAAIGYASTRLQDSASKKGNQQAIDYKVAEANSLLAQERANLSASQGGGGATTPPPSKGTPKWVLPVAIGGGVLVIGVVLYFVFKKK